MSRQGGVEIRVNGDPRHVEVGETVADLVAGLGFEPRTVAVERNGVIVPRDRFASVVLETGDRLEIVRFVQGGKVADGELFEYSLRRVGR